MPSIDTFMIMFIISLKVKLKIIIMEKQINTKEKSVVYILLPMAGYIFEIIHIKNTQQKR